MSNEELSNVLYYIDENDEAYVVLASPNANTDGYKLQDTGDYIDFSKQETLSQAGIKEVSEETAYSVGLPIVNINSEKEGVFTITAHW